MTNKQIGNLEAICLILTVMLNHLILNLPKGIISSTSSGAILNVIFISFIAIGIAFLISKLLEKFPHLDILDISNFLGGKWLKTILGILFLSYFVFTIGIVLRSFSEGLKIIFFPRTSVPVIMLLFLFAIVMVNKLGFRAICRSNLLIIPLSLFALLFIFFANFKNFHLQGMFPILGEGFQATFFAGISNLFAFGGITYLYFLPPFLKDEKAQKKIAFTSVGASGVCLLISVATLLFLSPTSIISEEVFPLYLASRDIEFGRFFQRLDAIFLLVWIILITSYLSIGFSFSTKIFQKLLHLQYTKWYVSLFAIILFGIALLPKDMYQIIFIENTIYQYFVLLLVFILSLGILVFANLKYRYLEKKKGSVSIDKASL